MLSICASCIAASIECSYDIAGAWIVAPESAVEIIGRMREKCIDPKKDPHSEKEHAHEFREE